MNRSLLARTYPNFYTAWAIEARSAGLTEEQVALHVVEEIRQAQCLLEGKCPKCGARSARYVNRMHQNGPSEVPGAWVMYRCSTAPPPGNLRPESACDFMVDLKEGDEAN